LAQCIQLFYRAICSSIAFSLDKASSYLFKGLYIQDADYCSQITSQTPRFHYIANTCAQIVIYMYALAEIPSVLYLNYWF